MPLWLTILLAGLLVLSSTGCGMKAAAPGRNRELTELKIGTSAPVESLDPTTTDAAAVSEALLYNLYETLVRVSSNGKITGLLAERWEISPHRKTYTFHLRNARFSNGKPLDSQAVYLAIQRILSDPKILKTRRKPLEVIQQMHRPNPRTIVFELSRPSNEWLYALSGPSGIIMDSTSFAQSKTKPIGSGPFQLDRWEAGEYVRLKKNPLYWGRGTALKSIEYRSYSDPNAQNTALLSGNLDIISNVTAPQSLVMFDPRKYRILEGSTNGEIVLGFNHQRAVLQDRRVRQAILYALDKRGMRDSVWAGHGQIIGSMHNPNDPWYEDLSSYYSYQPEKAKALLAQAGVKNLELRFRVPTLAYNTAANYIASQLAEVGIKVKIEELEFPATWVDQVMKKSNYDLTMVAHVEPHDIRNFARPDYYWHFQNARFNQLIQEADQGSARQQVEKYRAAARILAEEAAAGFLWVLPRIVVTRPDIRGISAQATNLSFDLTQAYLEPNFRGNRDAK